MIEPFWPRSRCPSIIFLPEVDELQIIPKATLTTFDHCLSGQFAVKGTGLLSDGEGIPRRIQALCCNRPEGTSTSLERRDAGGYFLTCYIKEYPSAMCEALSAVFLEANRPRPPAAMAKVKLSAITEEGTGLADWPLLL